MAALQKRLHQCTCRWNAGAQEGLRDRAYITLESTGEALERLSLLYPDELICALNFANGSHPGGGYLKGCRAQEEALCQQAHKPVHESLTRHYKRTFPHGFAGPAQNPQSHGVLYTRTSRYHAAVPSKAIGSTLRIIDLPLSWLSALRRLTCAHPDKSGSTHVDAKSLDKPCRAPWYHYRKKAHNTPQHLPHPRRPTTLILGAWGCGAFQNDPVNIAQAYEQVLFEERWIETYPRVIFAIPPDLQGGYATARTFAAALNIRIQSTACISDSSS